MNWNERSDHLMRMLFKPVHDSLNAVQGATKEFVPNKADRAKLLRTELVKIGDFVKTVTMDPDGSKMQDELW
jgi:chromodomain-helicase-DNA-binding protein 1